MLLEIEAEYGMEGQPGSLMDRALVGMVSSIGMSPVIARSTTAGTFSAPFHYIDALDNPPHTCGVDYARDCGPAGCVVSAISNYVRISDCALRLSTNASCRLPDFKAKDSFQPTWP